MPTPQPPPCPHKWRDTPLVEHLCSGCKGGARRTCSMCDTRLCLACCPPQGIPAPPPPPEADVPAVAGDEWRPAALGFVAPGSRVFVLSGCERGRAGTVLTVGATTGRADGCNIRLDGAKGSSGGWCLGKVLGEVVPQGNERIRLPAPLQSFHPDGKGPDRRLYYPASDVAEQLEAFGYSPIPPSREATLSLYDLAGAKVGKQKARGGQGQRGGAAAGAAPSGVAAGDPPECLPPPPSWVCACEAGPEDLEWLRTNDEKCTSCRGRQRLAWVCGACDCLWCSRCVQGAPPSARSGAGRERGRQKGRR